jgi:beta-1,4-mannosyltransferase
MIYVLVFLLFCLVAVSALIAYFTLRPARSLPKRAAVIVLGDIGRSPRMCNHALSLADEGWAVDLIGYAESTPSQRILQHPNIRIRPIAPGWKLPKRPRILYLLLAPVAAITRAFNLAAVIVGSGRKGIVLVQVLVSVLYWCIRREIWL